MGSLNNVVRQTLLKLKGGSGPQGDADLLERFAARGDQAAFEEIVRRHGPMVYRVCQRVLQQSQDAEDAFQATFVVLARKAGAIAQRELLGGWLHGVAQRVALKARARRQRHEQKRLAVEPAVTANAPSCAAEDWHSLLDQEISRLPDRYRLPVILCYLEGKTSDEAAGQLRCAPGTVRSQLSRACEMLRPRLARRGLVWSASGLATFLVQGTASAAPPAFLASAAVRQGLLTASQGATGAGAVSASVSSLVEATLREMARSHLKVVGLVVLAGVGLLGGLGWLMAGRFTSGSDPALAARPMPLGIHVGGSRLLFADDGKTLVSLAAQGHGESVKVWDVPARRQLAAFDLEGRVLGLSPDGKMLATRAADDGVRLFHARTGQELVMLAGANRAHHAAFSPDGRAIVVAGNGALRLWDTATGQPLPVRCDAPQDRPGQLIVHHTVAWSPDGRTLAALQQVVDAHSIPPSYSENPEEFWRQHRERFRTSLSARLVLLDAATGKQRSLFSEFIPHQSLLVFSPDGRWLATQGCGYGYVPSPLRVIDVATGREWRRLPGEIIGYGSMGFLPDSKNLFQVAHHFPDRTVRVSCFNLQNARERTLLYSPARYGPSGISGASVATTTLVVSPDGKTVAVAEKEGELGLLELKPHTSR